MYTPCDVGWRRTSAFVGSIAGGGRSLSMQRAPVAQMLGSQSESQTHFRSSANSSWAGTLIEGPVAQWIRHWPTESAITGSSPAGVVICRQSNLRKQQTNKQPHIQISKAAWAHWGLSLGRSACEADVILLYHVPLFANAFLSPLLNHRMASCHTHTRHRGDSNPCGQSPMDLSPSP